MKPRNKVPSSNGDLNSRNGHQTDVMERPKVAGTKRTGHRLGSSATSGDTTTYRLLDAILDNVPDRIYFKDREGRFIRLSKSVAHRLGVQDPALAIGKTDFDFNPPEKAREYFKDEQRIMETGEPLVNKIERHVLPDGDVSWTSTTKVPLRNQDGDVVGVVGINRDITDIKRAEQALRESYEELEQRVVERAAEIVRERQLLRTLVDNLPDVVYAKDADGRKTLSNPADVEIAGRDSETDMIGKTDFELFPREIAEKFYADDQKVMQGEAVINREEYFFNKQGQKRWLLTSKLPLRDQNKKIVGLVGIGRDITERKQAEETYATQQRLLDNLITAIPDLIYFKDKQSRFLRVNEAYARRAGLKDVQAALGKTDFDMFGDGHARQAYEDEKRILATGQPILNKEEQESWPDGRVTWVLSTKMPLFDSSGQVVGTMGVSHDITNRKQMEETLAHERSLLRTLIDNLPDLIYAKDLAGRKILANPADVKTCQCQSETELIGKTDFDHYPAEIAKKFRADDQKVMHGEPVINREEYLLTDGGRKSWLLTTKLPLRDQSGKIIGLVGIGRDITERKQVEEALNRERLLLRTVIDNVPDLIYAKDMAGRKILANRADVKACHFQSEADVLGKSDFDLFARDIAEKFWADDQSVLQGQPVINREEYFTDKDGGKLWLLTSKFPLHDRTSEIVGLVGIGRDITQRREAEEALRSSEGKLRQFTTQLERSNRELQDFAYVASHDLQEPLRKIVVFGERLKEQSTEKLDDTARDYLERMQKAASRMQTLINDLLTFSRVTTKARPFTQVDLAEVGREVLADLEGRIETVKGRVEMGTLPLIDAEPLQMRQLLQNLIGNALKFRKLDTPPVVKVSAEIITDDSSDGGATVTRKLCRLMVSDNGIGFDEKYLDRIFTVFQRLHSRNEYEGTGMGLAIARKIALFHRGEITAKSKPGEGATFIVTLPVTHPREPQNAGEKHD